MWDTNPPLGSSDQRSRGHVADTTALFRHRKPTGTSSAPGTGRLAGGIGARSGAPFLAPGIGSAGTDGCLSVRLTNPTRTATMDGSHAHGEVAHGRVKAMS